MSNRPARRLIWIPVIHTQADLGSLAEAVERLHVSRTGRQAWERQAETVDAMWDAVASAIEGLNLNYERVRLYQDGLPVCDHEESIVNDLAQAGSRNHQILRRLMQRGARLTGTEAASLLLEEYQLVRQFQAWLESGAQGEFPELYKAMSRRILERRDRYIAQRIDDTLEPDGTGLVFLGLLHSLDRLLPSDIEVTRFALGASDPP